MSDNKALAAIDGGALSARTQPGALDFSPAQEQIIRDTYANGASSEEFGVLMEIAKAKGLNPLLGQIWFVQRWDGNKKRMVWSAQTSIDGLRSVAARTGQYDGQDEPAFEYEGKALVKATVKVYRKDCSRPFVGVAFFEEYAARTKDGSLTQMWATKPHIMIAKCAEALAIRKGFPEASGIYILDEMEQTEAAAHVQVRAQPETTIEDQERDHVALDHWLEQISECDTKAALEEIAAEIAKAGKAGHFDAKKLKPALGAAYKARKVAIAAQAAADAAEAAAEEGM